MELKEYFKIFKEHIKLFSATIILIVLGSFAYFALRPVSYSASLALNITRGGIQQTGDYRYDDFYRLQADEKFAETVVEWLKNPRTVVDVYDKAGISTDSFSMRRLAKSFTAEKLSAQIVAVSFSAKDGKSAEKLSAAIPEAITENIKLLNKKQDDGTWFEIVAQDPVIIQDRIGALLIFLVSSALGIFVGFWVVLLKHYLE
ncbi:MAG: hypothetical protein Q8L10_00305 [Candidatus Moranbacteria bacterium]|nr:hypothetical protein [Candidatus Moranbacteria bacterium]